MLIAIIPAYNEERFIGSVVLKAKKFVDTVMVVDDGSSDLTAEIAQTAGAVVVPMGHNRGKGAALNFGFQKARELGAHAVVILDADGQHRPEEIPTVLAPIQEERADIVVGSRYLERKSRVPFARILGHRFFNYFTNWLTGTHITESPARRRGGRTTSPGRAG